MNSIGAAPGPSRTPVGTHLWLAAAIGAFFALVLFLVRAPVPRVVGGGFVLAVVGFGLLRALDADRLEWPRPPLGPAARTAGSPRWRLGGFDFMVGKAPHLSPQLRLRLRALATSILARRGLVAGTPGAIALLGNDSHELLFPAERVAGQGRPADPTGAELTALVDRLLELSEHPDASRRGFPGVPPALDQSQAAPWKGNR